VKKLKALLCVLIALAMTLPLCGCWDMTEINRRTYVLGIGIDEDAPGRYSFTFQTADVAKDAKQPAKTTEIKSTALAPALREMDRACEYDTTLIHLSSVVLGDSVKQDDMGALLGYLFSSSNVRRQCIVAAADGDAAELLNMGGDSPPAMQIATMIEKNDDAIRQSENLTLSMLHTALAQGEGFVVYRISTAQQQSVSGSDAAGGLRIAGANVYDRAGFSGEMNSEETELARLFSSGQTSGIIAAANDDGKGFFYRVDRSECQTVCSIDEDDRLVYDIKVTVHCSLADWESGGGILPDTPEEREIARSLEGQLEKLLERSRGELGAAALGLDSAARCQHYRWYCENRSDFPRIFSNAKTNLTIVCKK